MVSSSATTVSQYLAELPVERSRAIKTLIKTIDQSIPGGFVKEMRWGMITYSVPLTISGPTYNQQPLACVGIASQKNYISIYLMAIYASADLTEAFEKRWVAEGKKLNMGKSCVRIKTLDDANLGAIAWAASLHTPKEFTKMYLDARKDYQASK
jgi:hypothetical protein